MGSMFSKPPSVKTPQVPDPLPIPEVDTDALDDELARRRRRRSGRGKTVLTGELEPAMVGKKTLLG